MIRRLRSIQALICNSTFKKKATILKKYNKIKKLTFQSQRLALKQRKHSLCDLDIYIFCKNKNLLKWFQVMYFGCVALFITTDKSKGEKRLHFYLTRDFSPLFRSCICLQMLVSAATELREIVAPVLTSTVTRIKKEKRKDEW